MAWMQGVSRPGPCYPGAHGSLTPHRSLGNEPTPSSRWFKKRKLKKMVSDKTSSGEVAISVLSAIVGHFTMPLHTHPHETKW